MIGHTLKFSLEITEDHNNLLTAKINHFAH